MIALSSAIEVLDVVNKITGRPEYSWSIITSAGKSACSSDGSTQTSAVSYPCAGKLDLVFVCGGTNVVSFVDEKLVDLLRHIARDGVMLGAFCSGTYALAKAGLLDGYKCAIQWDDMASLRRTYHCVSFQDAAFIIDRDRITCTGGIAPLDLMLSLVGSHFGDKMVSKISANLAANAMRDTGRFSHIPIAEQIGVGHAGIVDIVALMEHHIEEPLSIFELAKQAGLSLRQVQRMFRCSLGMTPTHYYLRLRLKRARELLQHSSLSIKEISHTCGFDSQGYFSKSYREVYSRTPSSERNRDQFPA